MTWKAWPGHAPLDRQRTCSASTEASECCGDSWSATVAQPAKTHSRVQTAEAQYGANALMCLYQQSKPLFEALMCF